MEMLHYRKKRKIILAFLITALIVLASLLGILSTAIAAEEKTGGEQPAVNTTNGVNGNVPGSGSTLRKIGIVDFEPKATLVEDSGSKLQYRYDGLVDYKNVNLVWYFSYGFFGTFEDNLKNYVKFYEKETGKEVVLPNKVTQSIEVDQFYMEVTDWWFKRISGRAPLGLTLKSTALEPSKTYVIEIKEGFAFNNGKKMETSYSFEFTTTSSSPPPAEEKPREDEKPKETVVLPGDITGHWAEAAIKQAIISGVMKGYPDHSFKPENSITRAEFAAALVKALKLETKEGKSFADTRGHWAKDFISTATAYGIINGYDGNTFAPDEKITREQMAVMIGRAERMPAVQTGKSFRDDKEISSWAKDAVAWVSKHNIMSGYPDNSFHPKAFATRAEVAAILPRL